MVVMVLEELGQTFGYEVIVVVQDPHSRMSLSDHEHQLPRPALIVAAAINVGGFHGVVFPDLPDIDRAAVAVRLMRQLAGMHRAEEGNPTFATDVSVLNVYFWMDLNPRLRQR